MCVCMCRCVGVCVWVWGGGGIGVLGVNASVISVLWWRKPEYPEETTDLRQVTMKVKERINER